jgi:uncharacterized PurR-regulated membrane protein YhhQ (DUF165 family)
MATLADQRREVLLLSLAGLFIGFFIAADLLGAKLFSFTLFGLGPQHLGLGPATRFVATAGLLAFPLTFILTDVINEFFGKRTVRRLTFIAVGVSLLLQVVVHIAIAVPTVQMGPLPPDLARATGGDPSRDSQVAHASYAFAFGSSLAVVLGSLCAFLVSQLIDVQVFSRLRRLTGGRHIWLRAQGSTVISQLIDTVIVIYLAFVVFPWMSGGTPWPAFSGLGEFSAFSVVVTNYLYKFVIAVAITPLLYIAHLAVDAWFGREVASRLADEAHS